MLTIALILTFYLAVVSLLVWTIHRPRLKLLFAVSFSISYLAVTWLLFGSLCASTFAQAFGAGDTKAPPPGKVFVPGPKPLPETTVQRVQVVEKALNDPGSELRKLHNIAVETFVSKADFGQRRIPLKEELVQREPRIWSLEDLEKEPKVDGKELEKILLISLMTFAKPTPDNGRPKAEAGKGQHAVKNMKLPSNWRLDSLGLVGLLLHDRPVVYMNSDWSRMQDLPKAAKRPTDFLEEAGLDELRKGEDFYVREKEGELRMLGAIRATDQCMKCHSVERGDLLGAFTYTLNKASPTPKR